MKEPLSQDSGIKAVSALAQSAIANNARASLYVANAATVSLQHKPDRVLLVIKLYQDVINVILTEQDDVHNALPP